MRLHRRLNVVHVGRALRIDLNDVMVRDEGGQSPLEFPHGEQERCDAHDARLGDPREHVARNDRLPGAGGQLQKRLGGHRLTSSSERRGLIGSERQRRLVRREGVRVVLER